MVGVCYSARAVGRESGNVTKPKKTTKNTTKRPKNYRVLIHNDHYTTKGFVVWLLQTVFHHSADRAQQIMVLAHETGFAVAGSYSREVAEMKVKRCHAVAEAEGHPLEVTMEPD